MIPGSQSQGAIVLARQSTLDLGTHKRPYQSVFTLMWSFFEQLLTTDKRIVIILIFMTEDGKQKLVDETFSKIEEKATNGISKEELAISLKVYEKIYQNLLSKNEIETVDGNYCQNEGETTNESK